MDQDQRALIAKGFAAVLLGAVAIGFAPIFMRLTDVAPSATAFWRVSLALPFLLVWLGREKRLEHAAPASVHAAPFWGLVLVGLLFATELFFWHQSVARTTVANATLLANMATVFAALYGFLLFRERFGPRFLVGLALALTGAIALVGRNAELNPAYFRGDMLGLITAMTYAGYIVAAARIRRRSSTASVMVVSAIVTALVLAPAAYVEGGLLWPTSLVGWLPLLGLAWISHVLGQSLIIYGLAHVGAALGAASLLVQPIIAACLAWVLFGEQLSALQLSGALLILIGIVLAKTASLRKPLP